MVNNVLQSLKTDEHLSDIPTVFYEDNPDECLRELKQVLENQHLTSNWMSDKLFLNTNSDSEAGRTELADKMRALLNGKTVLLADDDMRNIYSMTSVLEGEGMLVVCALDGREALQRLAENPAIEIVLMDIMMPNMNGYEAMTEIRKDEKYKELPMIAVTAKAMSGDRDKCIEAGASDYITKPVNTEQLIALMKVWLYK